MKNTSKRIARISITTAMYVALTLVIAEFSYSQFQVRVAEMLLILCFFNSDYCYSMVLGCIIVNFFSPLGLVDVLFGTVGSLVTVLFYRVIKKYYLVFLPPLLGVPFVAMELFFFAKEPFWLSMLTVAVGEIIAVGVIGMPIFALLRKRREFLELIGADERYYSIIAKSSSRSDNKKDKENIDTKKNSDKTAQNDSQISQDVDDITSTSDTNDK